MIECQNGSYYTGITTDPDFLNSLLFLLQHGIFQSFENDSMLFTDTVQADYTAFPKDQIKPSSSV